MKISITFDSAEEFLQHIRLAQGQETALHIEPTAPEPEHAAPEPPAPAPESEAVPVVEVKPKEEPGVSMEEVRKLLADLNKKAGKNVAKELIKAAGYKKLTDVPAEKLPEIKAAAEKETEKHV